MTTAVDHVHCAGSSSASIATSVFSYQHSFVASPSDALDEYFHPTAWVGRAAVKYLSEVNNATDEQPWLLKVSFHRPHSPYDPPRRVMDMYK